MNRIDRILIFALVCGIPAAHAGQSGPTGSVVGTVQNDETNLPVRLAEIRLVPRSTVAETSKPHVMRVRGMAGMDGTFRMDGVPAGDCIAGALMAGYVTPGVSPLDARGSRSRWKDR